MFEDCTDQPCTERETISLAHAGKSFHMLCSLQADVVLTFECILPSLCRLMVDSSLMARLNEVLLSSAVGLEFSCNAAHGIIAKFTLLQG